MQENPDMSRRGALTWLRNAVIGGAAVTMLPKWVLAAPGYEGTPWAESDFNFFNTLLRDRNVLNRFRRSPTQEQVTSMVRVLACGDTSWATQAHRESWYHAGSREMLDSERRFRGNGTVVRVPDGSSRGGTPRYRYVLVTAQHVADVIPPPNGRAWTRHPRGHDIATCEISEAQAMRHPTQAGQTAQIEALDLDMESSAINLDISGHVGMVLGHSRRSMRTSYPSVVSPRLSKPIYTMMNVLANESVAAETRAIVIPPGQTRSVGGTDVEASGMSGSAYLLEQNGRKVFGGIIVSVFQQSVGGTTYEFAEILDHVLAREAIAATLSGSGSVVAGR